MFWKKVISCGSLSLILMLGNYTMANESNLVWDSEAPGSAREDVRIIPGPLPGTKGSLATGEVVEINSMLETARPLEAGTLSCWVYLQEPLLSGPNNDSWRESIVAAPGHFEITLGMDPRFLSFFFHWRGEWSHGGSVRFLIPGISGPGWHHLAAVWDVSKGYHNLYVDGSPALMLMEDGVYWDSLPAPQPQAMKATLGRIGLSGARMYDRALSREEIAQQLTPLYEGSSDLLLGQRSLGKLSVDTSEMNLLHEDDFTDASRSSEWVLEGPGALDYSSDGLYMKSTEPDGPMGHYVYWLDKKLPENFVAEWEVAIRSEFGSGNGVSPIYHVLLTSIERSGNGVSPIYHVLLTSIEEYCLLMG
jgi:hypothetical protein